MKSNLPQEMVTPDPQWELEMMTVDNVCEFLKKKMAFLTMCWILFEVIFVVELNCKHDL